MEGMGETEEETWDLAGATGSVALRTRTTTGTSWRSSAADGGFGANRESTGEGMLAIVKRWERESWRREMELETWMGARWRRRENRLQAGRQRSFCLLSGEWRESESSPCLEAEEGTDGKNRTNGGRSSNGGRHRRGGGRRHRGRQGSRDWRGLAPKGEGRGELEEGAMATHGLDGIHGSEGSEASQRAETGGGVGTEGRRPTMEPRGGGRGRGRAEPEGRGRRRWETDAGHRQRSWKAATKDEVDEEDETGEKG